MVVRVIGIGLLLIVGLPLAIVLSPLLVLGLGVWVLATRWWSGDDVRSSVSAPLRAAVERRLGSGWHPSELANHTRLSPRDQPSGARRGETGSVMLALVGAVVLFSAIGAVARQAPLVLVPILVLGAVLALRAAMRRFPRPGTPRRATAPPSRPLPSLSDAELAQRVARLLREFEFHSLQSIGQAGRPGFDLIARDRHGHLYLVQCRQDAAGDRAGSADVRRLVEAVARERAAGGILVTTARFTQAAINLARYSRVPIVLYDGQALARPPARTSWAWPITYAEADGPHARAAVTR